MSYRWMDSLGQIIDEQWTLSQLIEEDANTAAFLTSLQTVDSPVMIRLMAATADEADRQYHSWSIATGLAHPGLARVYAVGRTRLDGFPVIYAVMKVPDDNLGAVTRDRALSNEEARVVLESVLPAIAYLHHQRFVHANIVPSSIIAVGERVKLRSDSILEAGSDTPGDLYTSDAYQLGATLVEILTQEKYTNQAADARPEESAIVAALKTPFREIAIGCLQPDPKRRWTIARAVQALAGLEPPEQAPSVGQSFSRNPKGPSKMLLGSIAAILVCLVAMGAVRYYTGKLVASPQPSPRASESAAPEITPRIEPEGDGSRIATRSRLPASAPGWAVVAAIYDNFAAAERRAQSMQKRWGQFEAKVYPAKGQGRRYMVILGSGLTRSAADNLRNRAVAAGLPGDTYVTKIGGSSQDVD